MLKQLLFQDLKLERILFIILMVQSYLMVKSIKTRKQLYIHLIFSYAKVVYLFELLRISQKLYTCTRHKRFRDLWLHNQMVGSGSSCHGILEMRKSIC